MASAQILPNSRKLGHLEAGKKKLEEFRKKKAEGRAKKATSSGQLVSADADQCEKVSQKYEHVRAKSAVETDSDASGMAGENKAVNSSQSTEIHSSNRAHGSTSVLVDSNHASYGESIQYAGKEVPKLYENSGFPELVNGCYDQQNGSSELSHEKETETGPSGGSAPDQFDAFNSVKANSNLDMGNSSSLSFFKAPPGEDRNSSEVQMSHPQTSFANSWSTSVTESISGQNRWGFPSTSANTSGLHKEPSTGVELSHPGSLYKTNATDFGVRGGKIADSIDHNLNVDSVHWQPSETSYKDSSLGYTGTQYDYPFASTGSGSSSARSRPSFLDSLGVSRAPPTAYVPYGEPAKANTSGSFDISTVQSTGLSLSSPARPFAEFNTADQSLKSMTPDFKSDNELRMNTLVSSNDGKLLQLSGNHHVQRDHELFISRKDEDFAALEQHIEDLTQEKFSLQRALETSRTLAESLAAENSSLTDSYNHQGKIVSQLKTDMERLQEEIKAQLLALESIRSEYVNAQLECNAADERAKILASEVISLEEKALRLRSNELKLEKQLENMNSEITSYKCKISILEKERQDFQSTIDALQEEKKLLQSKLRKVSTNEKVDAKKTSIKRDVSTSTEDLGVDPFNFVGETSTTDRMLNNNNIAQDIATMIPSTDASTSSLVPEDRIFPHPDASSDIPHDQLRMIENINSLISELALEKEELVGALKIESSNCAKLKDLNKDLSQKLEAQTQRLELLIAQRMANENVLARPVDRHSMQDTTEYADEGDEVVERVLGWIMKLFPGGPSKRRTNKLL